MGPGTPAPVAPVAPVPPGPVAPVGPLSPMRSKMVSGGVMAIWLGYREGYLVLSRRRLTVIYGTNVPLEESPSSMLHMFEWRPLGQATVTFQKRPWL